LTVGEIRAGIATSFVYAGGNGRELAANVCRQAWWLIMLRAAIYALILIGISLVIHSSGLVALGFVLVNRRYATHRKVGVLHILLVLMTIFTVLMMLHLSENCVWAAFYWQHGLFRDYETSLYFSLATYTTIGYGDELLPEKWRLLGSLQGIAGVLLCGLSTAFLFSIMSVLFQTQIRRLDRERHFTEDSDTGQPDN
jgi:hypothetical protein